MRKPMPKVLYQGETITFRDLAKRTGIHYDALRSRYLRGIRGEALVEPSKESSARLFLKYQGRTQSVRAWAKELGIMYETLRQRIVRGDPTAGLEGAELVESGKTYIKRGKGSNVKANLQALARQHGLSYELLHARYYRGWRGEALVKPADKSVKHYLNYQGRTQSLRNWTRELGIPYATALARIHRGASDSTEILSPVIKPDEVVHISKSSTDTP